MSEKSKKGHEVGKTFTSQRNTQIVISKKYNIRVGDLVKYIYKKDDEGEILYAELFINDEFISKFSVEELSEFFEIFLQSEM